MTTVHHSKQESQAVSNTNLFSHLTSNTIVGVLLDMSSFVSVFPQEFLQEIRSLWQCLIYFIYYLLVPKSPVERNLKSCNIHWFYVLQAESLNHSLSQFSSGKVALNVIYVPAFGRHTPVNLECVSGAETRKHFHHVSLWILCML